jgi:hypothetical protein
MESKGNRSNERQPPQAGGGHPPEWAGDLEPDRMAGQNIGLPSEEREIGLATAYDVRQVHRALADRFQDDELRQIPLLRDGQRLQQGATYVELGQGEPREFTATGGMEASAGRAYVPKDRVPYPLWNRLIGIENPARLDEGGREREDR